METYTELKKRHAEDLNNFKGIFFAFSNEQFREGMKKIELMPDDTKKICSLGAGGYILKEKSKSFSDMFKRHREEMKQKQEDEFFLFSALVYELQNHEYGYTYDPTAALDSLGLTADKIKPELLKKAMAAAVIE